MVSCNWPGRGFLSKGEYDARVFGRVVRYVREFKGMSQQELGKSHKLHKPDISNVEGGTKNLLKEKRAALAETLGVTRTFLETYEPISPEDRTALVAIEQRLARERAEGILDEARKKLAAPLDAHPITGKAPVRTPTDESLERLGEEIRSVGGGGQRGGEGR